MNLREISDDFLVFGNIAVLVRHTGSIEYDFDFRRFLDCKSVVSEIDCPVLLHIGAIPDYAGIEHMMQNMGLQLLVHEAEHVRCSTIENWYPYLKEKTPYTKVYETLPSPEELEADFTYPIFIKGNRQTNHHRRSQCIVEDAAQYSSLRETWRRDGILSWQKAAVRNYVPLMAADEHSFPDMVPFSFEFRFFFFCGEYVTHGPYWTMARPYALSAREYPEALELAAWASRQINVPFVAVDVAKTREGKWIVIEVNDALESGYTGANPITLWKNLASVSQTAF